MEFKQFAPLADRALQRRWFFRECGVGLAGIVMKHKEGAHLGLVGQLNHFRQYIPTFLSRSSKFRENSIQWKALLMRGLFIPQMSPRSVKQSRWKGGAIISTPVEAESQTWIVRSGSPSGSVTRWDSAVRKWGMSRSPANDNAIRVSASSKCRRTTPDAASAFELHSRAALQNSSCSSSVRIGVSQG